MSDIPFLPSRVGDAEVIISPINNWILAVWGKDGWKRWIIWRCQAQRSPGTTPAEPQKTINGTKKAPEKGQNPWILVVLQEWGLEPSLISLLQQNQALLWMHRLCHSCFGDRTRSFSLFYTEKRADFPNYTRFPKYGSGTTLLIIARNLCKKLHYKFNVKIGFPNRIWIMFSATCRTTYCTWPSPSVNSHSSNSSLISDEDVTLKTTKKFSLSHWSHNRIHQQFEKLESSKEKSQLDRRAGPWCMGSFSQCHWFLPCQLSLIKGGKAGRVHSNTSKHWRKYHVSPD